MSMESGRSSDLRTVLIAAGLVIVVFGLKAAAAIVSPIVLALIVAVPLTMVVMKLFLAGSEETGWLVALMGGSGQVGDSPEQELAN